MSILGALPLSLADRVATPAVGILVRHAARGMANIGIETLKDAVAVAEPEQRALGASSDDWKSVQAAKNVRAPGKERE